MIAYCECMLVTHDEPVYCNFTVPRAVFFAYSILCISLMEMTSTVRGFRSPLIRVFSFLMVFVLFGSAKAYFGYMNNKCGSFDFRINNRVIQSTCTASLVVVAIVSCAEALAWRKAYNKAVLRFQDTEYNKEKDLKEELSNVSLGSALATTVSATGNTLLPTTASTQAAAASSSPSSSPSSSSTTVKGIGFSLAPHGSDNNDGMQQQQMQNNQKQNKTKKKKMVRRQDTYDFSSFDGQSNDSGSEPEDIFESPYHSDADDDDNDDDYAGTSGLGVAGSRGLGVILESEAEEEHDGDDDDDTRPMLGNSLNQSLL